MTRAKKPSVAQLGMVGLGRMGGNMAERLRRVGHEVVRYDRAAGERLVRKCLLSTQSGH